MGYWKDVRYAARRLASAWAFTLAAAFTLALGIGANATVFTIVNALMLRELPFTDHDRVVSLGSEDDTGRRFGVAIRDFEDWRDSTKTIAGMALWGSYTWNVSDPGREPDRYWGAYISGNVFQLMGQRPLIGRDFVPADDQPGAPPVVIFSHNVWQNRYGGDPGVLGRVVKVSEIPATVIGIMPPGMNFPPNTDAWVPLAFMPPAVRNLNRSARNYGALARLADGATIEQARAELTAIGESLARQHPDTNEAIRPTVMTYSERMRGGDQRVLLLLMGAVGFVLLIACANVANLLLARSAHRTREVGVRVALGATRWRIVRQLLVESVLLAIVGGVIGSGIAVVALRVFEASTLGVGWPYWVHFTMDGTVFAFLAAICLGTGILFGLAPALHVSKTDVNHVLKEGGRTGTGGARARRWAGALVTLELALTLVLLSGAGLMMRSFLALYSREIGFNQANLLVMSLSLASRRYPTPDSRAEFYARLEERLGAIPAVQAGAVASHSPFGGFGSRPLAIDGRDASGDRQPLAVDVVSIGPAYFDALGIRLLRGRTFVGTDGQPGREHVIVNQEFVTRYFPGRDPIGHRVRLSAPPAGQQLPGDLPSAGAQQQAWHTIVGVAPTVSQRFIQNTDPQPLVYLPHHTQSYLFSRLLVRTATGAAAVAPLVRAELRTVDPDIPVVDIMTMGEYLARQRQGMTVIGTMFSIFAIVALLLSAVGLYAVTAHSVIQRTTEIGIRMALGARPEQVRRLFVRRLIVHLGVGLTAGLAGALAVGTVLRSLLFEIGPFDPSTLAATAVVLTAVAVAACVLPARAATRVDPIVALRYE